MNKIVTIDCNYIRPRFAASYLMIEGDHALFVENNTAHSVPLLLEALKSEGMRPEQVDYLIVTHVHLDHAGGSSALMKACPRARLLAHPKAASHLIDPARLVSSAKRVYGDAIFAQLYGEITPIPAERVQSMADGEILRFGSRELRFIHTRGHANHHFCVYDPGSEGVFTGDAFGLAYPDLQVNGLIIFPSTSPTDFDPLEAKASVRKIVDSGAKRAFLTHFGEVSDLPGAAAQLLEHLEFSEALLNQAATSAASDADLPSFCETRLRAYLQNALRKRGISPDVRAEELLRLDLELNAAGIAHVARKRRNDLQKK